MEQAQVVQIWLTWLFVVALAAEFFFAGAGAFGATGWDLHQGFGFVLVIGSVALLVVAAIARRLLALSAIVVALMIAQLVLANLGREASEWLGAIHALNALVVFGVAMMIALRAQRVRIAARGEAAPGPEPRA